MKEKLRAADFRFIAICALLLGATVWFSARNFYRAFPEASIDFRVNRDDGETLGSRFLASQGYQVEGYREASSFTYDDDAKTFLEREAGLEQANRIMGSRVHLWRWSYRWFRPLQKEEFRADITPQGALAGFQPRNCRGRRAARRDRGRGSCPGREVSSAAAFIATPARSISSKSPKSHGPTGWTVFSPGRNATSICTTPPTASR